MARSISTIAREIRGDWKNPYFGAVPYIDAMECVESVSDPYGYEDGRTLVIYFLANAQTWRGETAKRVKAELKGMVK